MQEWFYLCTVDDLVEDEVVPLDAGGFELVAVMHRDKVSVFEDNCPHLNFPISHGYVDGAEIICAWHGACFELQSGAITAGPTAESLRRFEVRKDGRQIWIRPAET